MIRNSLSQMKAKSLDAGKYADGQGLWLFKRNRDAGKWILRITVSGRRREMGLGPWPDVSIAEARERAAEARRTLRDGLDPIVERQKQKLGTHQLTMSQAVESCFVAGQAELKNDGIAGRWLSPLSVHVLPKIGNYPVQDIDQHVLKSVLGRRSKKSAITPANTAVLMPMSKFTRAVKMRISSLRPVISSETNFAVSASIPA